MIIENFNDLILDNIGSIYNCISDISCLVEKDKKYVLCDITHHIITYDATDSGSIYNMTDANCDVFNCICYVIDCDYSDPRKVILPKFVSPLPNEVITALSDVSFDKFFVSLSERRKDIIEDIKN